MNKLSSIFCIALLTGTLAASQDRVCDISPEKQAELDAQFDAQMESLTDQMMVQVEDELHDLAEEMQEIYDDPSLHLKILAYLNLALEKPEFYGYDPQLVKPTLLTDEEIDALSNEEALAREGNNRQLPFQMTLASLNLRAHSPDSILFQLDILNHLFKDSLPASLEDLAADAPALGSFWHAALPYIEDIDKEQWSKIKARYGEEFAQSLALFEQYKEYKTDVRYGKREKIASDKTKTQKDFTPQIVNTCRYLFENYKQMQASPDLTKNELLYMNMGMRALAMWIFITDTWGDIELSVEDEKLFYACLQGLNADGIVNILKYARNTLEEPASTQQKESAPLIREATYYLVPADYLKQASPISTDSIIQLCSEKLDTLFPERKNYQKGDWQVL